MKLSDFRKVGERFMFMGVECVVTRIVEECTYQGVGPLPAYMVATYVDRAGRLRQHEFRTAELPALLNENPDEHPTIYTREGIIETLVKEHDELLAKNATVSLSMQGGYSDGVKDLFHRLHARLVK